MASFSSLWNLQLLRNYKRLFSGGKMTCIDESSIRLVETDTSTLEQFLNSNILCVTRIDLSYRAFSGNEFSLHVEKIKNGFTVYDTRNSERVFYHSTIGVINYLKEIEQKATRSL